MTTATLPDLISEAQTTEEQFLRHIFVRDQMAEWSKHPLIMTRADGVCYWDVSGKRYLDALSGIYVVSVGQQSPHYRGDPQTTGYTAFLAADARHQSGRRTVGEPAGGVVARRPTGSQIPVRRLGSHGG